MLPDLLLETGSPGRLFKFWRATVKTTVLLRYSSFVGLIGIGRSVAALGRKRQDRTGTLSKIVRLKRHSPGGASVPLKSAPSGGAVSPVIH